MRAPAPTKDSRITWISILTYEANEGKESGYNWYSIESGWRGALDVRSVSVRSVQVELTLDSSTAQTFPIQRLISFIQGKITRSLLY